MHAYIHKFTDKYIRTSYMHAMPCIHSKHKYINADTRAYMHAWELRIRALGWLISNCVVKFLKVAAITHFIYKCIYIPSDMAAKLFIPRMSWSPVKICVNSSFILICVQLCYMFQSPITSNDFYQLEPIYTKSPLLTLEIYPSQFLGHNTWDRVLRFLTSAAHCQNAEWPMREGPAVEQTDMHAGKRSAI